LDNIIVPDMNNINIYIIPAAYHITTMTLCIILLKEISTLFWI